MSETKTSVDATPGLPADMTREYPMRRLVPLMALAAVLALGVGCTGQPGAVDQPKATDKEAPKEKDAPKGAAGEAKAPNALDWPEMRGPEQNGVARDKNLPDSFSPDPNDQDSNLLWKQPYGGRSTPVVMNHRVYVINPTNEGVSAEERLNLEERVMCFDADNGKVLWEHRFPVFHTGIVAARVGWTSVVGDPETDNVYAHGVQGLLFCFEGKTGKVLWQRSLTEEYGRVSGYGGRVTTPVIDGDLLIMGMVNSNWGEYARGGNRFVAFDKKTGEVAWWSETGLPVKFTYASTPVVAVINGERLLISGGGDGAVHAFQVRTGKRAWSYLFSTGGINPAPVVDGNFVYSSHGDENLEGGERGMLVCLDASKVKDGKPELVWKDTGHLFKFASPIVHEGKLYACDENATMYCFDAKTGKRLWRYSYGKSAKGSPVWADGKIYVNAVGGEFHIVDVKGDKPKTVFKTTIESRLAAALEFNGGPAVADSRVYFMTSQDMYCVGFKDGKPAADPIPTRPTEAKPGGGGDKAAQLLVFPADVTLTPGGSAGLKARLYDAEGRFLREADKLEWAAAPFLAPPPIPGQPPQAGPPPPTLQGKVGDDGKLTVSDKVPSQFGGVLAKADGLEGRARVRVAPVLPYSQDFEKVPENRTPGGWINAQGKYLVKDLKGAGKVLMKNNTNAAPPVARANIYITLPSAKDYTVQADLMGRKKGNDMPDMGVVNSRYNLVLAGQYQQLRLLGWDALPRVDKSVPFEWKSDVWYTMKFTVEPAADGKKATIKGKVWEKNKAEPEGWTVTFDDPAPYTEGSGGLYGYATGIEETVPGTEIYYDNVKITPNKK
jgi:outer membrane protein assembly factor BamB